jgi:glycosyltransferase involved in cell wall biosynthesis
LPEVVEHQVTGFVVEKENPEATAEALEKLISDSGLRSEMGRNGRAKVLNEYNWKGSVEKMLSVYDSILNTE